MYETQVGMDAGTKWFHKGSELELMQKAPKPKQESGFISSRGIRDRILGNVLDCTPLRPFIIR
jgi:hypothetical protein